MVGDFRQKLGCIGHLSLLLLALQACSGPLSSETVSKNPTIPTVTGSCANGSTTASLKVFLENPRTSSGNSSLAFNATLTSGQTLPATMSGLDGSCLLRTDRYSLTTDSIYPSNIAALNASSNALLYAPTQPEFQQVNSFYYANALKSLLVSLGADLSSMGRVSLDAHCNVSNNAYYSPVSKLLCFGYSTQAGGKKVWAADDGDVVVHETGHGINHTLASTSILNSTGEAGAIDEAVADYWALSYNNDPELSEWFLGSISGSLIRDASMVLSYPSDMEYEIHDDSRVLTQVLWDLRKSANLGKNTTDALVKRALQLLPGTTRYKDFYQAFYDASGPAFLNLSSSQRNLILSKFIAKGIHRVDTATGFRLSTAGGSVKQVYIIDDHSISAQAGGNCNGQLDVGETVLALVNLENPNVGEMGMGVATLSSVPAGISIPSGGQIGEFYRFAGNSDFVSALPSSTSNRRDATIMSSFLISASSAGVKNFSLTFVPMYADPTHVSPVGVTATVNFSLTVGGAATSSNCSAASLWP